MRDPTSQFGNAALAALAVTLGMVVALPMLGPTGIARADQVALPEGECADAEEFMPDPFQPRIPLGQIRVPEPPNLGELIRNKKAAIVLGKALFWDMQVGSDGIQACASCHFRAGADPRSKNQLFPGSPDSGNTFFSLGGPNYQLTSEDFPLHTLADPRDRSSVIDSRDVIVSSQGVLFTQFGGTSRGVAEDRGTLVPDPAFHVAGVNTRRAEPRNTPTMINAVFNLRNFWDGRAQATFNGVNAFGDRDPNAMVVRASGRNYLEQVRVRLVHSSLASQAVAPPVSDKEMSFIGRPFRDIGKKMVSLQPLAKQEVDPTDSVLGPFGSGGGDDGGTDAARPRRGLRGTYASLIRAAFRPEWWRSDKIIKVDANGSPIFLDHSRQSLAEDEYTLMEYNFSLFFGLAVQVFEATLVSDDAPIDRFFTGDPKAITEQQKRGLELFQNEGGCIGCHSPPEFAGPTVRKLATACENQAARLCEPIERMVTGNCDTEQNPRLRIGLYDQGFYNIGVRPMFEDLGVGNNDPLGNPLSMAVMSTLGQFGKAYPFGDTPPNLTGPSSDPGALTLSPNEPPVPGERMIEKGAFKAPILRNVELTAPYFHNGGQRTLRQVVEFYNRGGNFRETNVEMIDLGIGRRGMTEQQVDDIVAFLLSLTDERVRLQKAPFDHPQIIVPNGHPTDDRGFVLKDANGRALDSFLVIPAVGRSGGPLPPGFLEPADDPPSP